jgi:hypothetical protein
MGRFVVTGEENAPVVTASGPALGLASRITGFASIRHPWVAVWTADDVFEVEIRREGRIALKAERRAGEWADPKGRVVEGADGWLARLLHLKIERYLDAPEAGARFERIASNARALRAVFRDRLGRERWMAVEPLDGHMIAVSGERPRAAFAVSDESGSLFSLPSPGR